MFCNYKVNIYTSFTFLLYYYIIFYYFIILLFLIIFHDINVNLYYFYYVEYIWYLCDILYVH